MGQSWKSTDNYGKSWEHDMGWDDWCKTAKKMKNR
jgi:hypothetical protein